MQIEEQQYFNWKCLVCGQVALFPLHVEMQWLVNYDPHLDIDGSTKWVKCGKCFSPYHVTCLQSLSEIPTGPYVCTFLGCKQ